MSQFPKLHEATPEQKDATHFYFARNDSGVTWVSEYLASEESVTDQVKSLGDVYCHLGRFTDHSELTAFLKEKEDHREVKDFIFEVSFHLESSDDESIYDDGLVYFYSENEQQARADATEYLKAHALSEPDDVIWVNAIYSLSED